MAKLGDVCVSITDGSHNPPVGVEQSPFIMLSSKNIEDNYISLSSPRYLSESDYASENKRTQISAGDLLVTIVGTIGRVAIVPPALEGICVQRSVAVLKTNPDIIDNRFLMYQLQNMRPHLEREAKGVAQKGIYLKQLSSLTVSTPPMEEQKRIAAVLDKVTDLIAQRHAQLDKLDLLVKSRFVEMFGDPATNPMGWKRTTIGQECYYIKDGPHKSLADVGTKTGYPFISVRNIVNGTIDFSTAKYISEEDYNEAIKKCNPQKGDMLYTKGGTTGIAKLVDVDIKFANWVHVAVLKFDSSLDGVFFENMLNSDYCYKQSQELTKGIANKDLVLGSMAQIKMYKPPLSLQKQFAKFVKQIGKEKNFISHSLDQLQTLKKSLTQQYFGSR